MCVLILKSDSCFAIETIQLKVNEKRYLIKSGRSILKNIANFERAYQIV